MLPGTEINRKQKTGIFPSKHDIAWKEYIVRALGSNRRFEVRHLGRSVTDEERNGSRTVNVMQLGLDYGL